jgi:hypothetical protein
MDRMRIQNLSQSAINLGHPYNGMLFQHPECEAKGAVICIAAANAKFDTAIT